MVIGVREGRDGGRGCREQGWRPKGIARDSFERAVLQKKEKLVVGGGRCKTAEGGVEDGGES